MSTFTFKDTVIVTLAIATLYLVSPLFRDFLESFKRDLKEFDSGIPEIEMENVEEYGPFPEKEKESDFSDISVSHAEDFDKYKKLFREI